MSNINLNTILQVTPDKWSETNNNNYSSTNYVTVEVTSYSDEYNSIVAELRSNNLLDSIQRIERVQHPFAFARFLLRKEQLEQRHGYTVGTVRTFYKTEEDNIKEFLEYNLDKRRIQESILFMNKMCVVATQRLNKTITRDSEQYPEYVIYFD